MVYIIALLKILAAVALLVAPILMWSLISSHSEKSAAEKTGRQRCTTEGWEFVDVAIYKNHFVLIYKDHDQSKRAKFRMRHCFSKPLSVEWLP